MPKTTKNTKNAKTVETKIVRASERTDRKNDTDSSKVKIKAVDKAIIEAQIRRRKAAAAARENKRDSGDASRGSVQTERRAPARTSPVQSSAFKPLPFGRPMPKNAVPQKKADVPKTEEAAEKPAPAETALPEKPAEIPAEAPVQKPEAAEEKKEPVKAEETQESAKAEEIKEPAKAEEPKEAVESEEKKTEKPAPDAVPAAKEATPKAEAPTKPEPPKRKQSAEPGKRSEKKSETRPARQGRGSGTEKSASGETRTSRPTLKIIKRAEPKQEKIEKKPEPETDYTPGIGVKIIRRAADEPKPEPKKTRPEKKAGRGEGISRKPKEFVGKKGEGKGEDSPRKRSVPRVKGSGGRDKVVAYTAPAGGDKRRRSKDKDKDKRKNERFDATPLDLSRSIHKKHSKYKEKVEVVDEKAELFENLPTGSVVIDVPITLGGFCEQIERSTSEAVIALMKMGIMANINQNLDEDTAVLLGEELGVNVVVNKIEEVEEEEGLDLHEDAESELKPRPPVITVMGHVDHGKTSLLDAIRNTNKTEDEAGGITQHIGASEVKIKGQRIVFLDTPGHEAFTAMRARGAHITDIAVLVVAADDSVKPQTVESISHAKAAGVPIIVAINKMDKAAANAETVKKDLADHGVLVEEWGGNVICVPVSAKTGMGIDRLLEMILLQAEMLELRANPDRMAQGTVIEARLDKARGPVATLLVTNGTLQMGAPIVVGTSSGRVRAMNNSKGAPIREAGPATPVEITGLTEVPESGDEFHMVKEERIAREIAAKRKEKLREEVLAKNASVSLEKLFSQFEEGEVKDLNIIIKADVQGSVEALQTSLEKEQTESVRIKTIHAGVGAINESDVMLASTANAVIIGFNVRPSAAVQAMAAETNVEIRTYRVIYEAIDDVRAAIKGMLKPELKEAVLGSAEVRNTFKVPNVGIIAGAYVTNGKVVRNAQIRLVRDGVVIHEGSISSLKRFKDDAKEVLQGFECGIGIDKYNDIKEGDILEAYEMREVKAE